MKVTVTKRALRQIEQRARWWTEHRPAAPSMFMDELAAAERRLIERPEIGIAYATHRTGIIRRVLLEGTKHHLYYRYRADRREIVVLSVWGAPRGRGPKL